MLPRFLWEAGWSRIAYRGIYGALRWLLVPLVLGAAYSLGAAPAKFSIVAVVAAGAGLVILRMPVLGLPALIVFALLFRRDISTGTEVALNPTTLLIPALLALWLVRSLLSGHLRLAASRVTPPLALFLASGLLSLGIGTIIWDSAVPRSGNFLLVQLAQWAIFALSAGVFWIVGDSIKSEVSLRRLTFFFIVVAGILAVTSLLPRVGTTVRLMTTDALIRPAFWMVLAALAGGQLFFNRQLSVYWRLFLVACLVASIVFAFDVEDERNSNWVAVGAVLAVLLWLRFPRLRIPVLAVVAILLATGVLWSTIYNFAGGDAKWSESGGARLALIGRVVEVTMRNPITGLGPAAYRPYGFMKPLPYQTAYWIEPRISSHNNYVDLFSHVGLLGLALFVWFAVEFTLLLVRLIGRYKTGFAAGYVRAMLATWIGALAIMLLADWILPFVYNIGFQGFQASILVWLFLGGALSLDRLAPQALPGPTEESRA